MKNSSSAEDWREEMTMWFSAVGCIITLTLSLLVAPLAAEAQPAGKMPRIGVLAPGTPAGPWVNAFRQGLHALGYVEDQTITLEIRWDEGQLERRLTLAAELVAHNVDVLVAGTGGLAQAAQRATTTTPIVMLVGTDPVELGLVTSLARPGGTVTGLSVTTLEMTQKRLELLKEAVPSLSRVAVLWVAAGLSRGPQLELQALEEAAHVLGVQLVPLEVYQVDDLDRLFETASREGVHAVLTGQQPFFTTHRVRLAALALQHHLPLMSGEVEVAEAGGLMTYGPNIVELWRRLATYVDKLLKGATPAELPVEQPVQFELVLNLKTAQALGLTLPPHLLILADKVHK